MKNNLDFKTLGGWIVAIALAIVTTASNYVSADSTKFDTLQNYCSEKYNDLKTKNQILEVKVASLEKNQDIILQTVKDINSKLDNYIIQNQNKK